MNTLIQKIKFLLSNLIYRLKPRLSFRWILSFVLWLAVLVYVGMGIFYAFKIYKSKSINQSVRTAAKLYPMPAAIIDGRTVWAKDYFQQLKYIEQFSSKTKQPLPDSATLRVQIMDQLIENKILEFQAIKYGARVTKKDVDDAYKKIVDQSGGPAEVKKVLNELYGMNEKEFKSLVRDQVIKEKVQNEVIAQVKVSHILIKDEGRAKEVAEKAKKGENFGDLAKQFSEDTKSRDNGGQLGWLSKGQLVVDGKALPEFDQAAFNAKNGEIVGPVKTEAGFDILKVEDKKGKLAENFDGWLSGLKKQTKIWRMIK